MMKEYRFDYHKSFQKEFNKMSKRCPSLEEDFERFKKAILVDLDLFNNKLPERKYLKISGLGNTVKLPIFKFRNFRCKTHKKNKFRFIFIFHEAESLIYFVEFYYKGNNEKENKNRILNCF
ncbi:MAG: hypothetical protein ACRC1M_04630 [Methanobacteriaceae archaeon]